MNKTQHRRVSFLGELIIIIIIAVAVFVFLRMVDANQVEEIQAINQEFGVGDSVLVPEETRNYISRLKTVKNTEYTEPLIEYAKLNIKEKEINRLVKLTALKQEKCIPKKLKLKVNSFVLMQDRVLELFEESKDDKVTEALNWNTYIQILENTTEYKDLKYEIQSLTICS